MNDVVISPLYLQDLSRSDLQKLLEDRYLLDPKKAKFHSTQIFQWIYQKKTTAWSQMTDIGKLLRTQLERDFPIFDLKVASDNVSEDGTRKFLWGLPDGKTVESVVIPAKDRLTLCISSQVGCAMACGFCLTGIQGLDRNLSAHEIISQVWKIRNILPITNVVFMGMGEPLNNLENVIKTCEVLIDPLGFGFSKRRVTVSTSGLIPGIEELGRRIDVSLAISLNASTDEQRSEIMPVNRKWNLDILMTALRKYPLGPHRRITFEYVLIRDFNDSIEDAKRVSRLLNGIPSKVNLIPFNEHPGAPSMKRPSEERVKVFQHTLLNSGLTATIRHSRGRDILAACGQLRSQFGTARGTEKHSDSSYRV